MNLIKKMKRHSLGKLLVFERLYAEIEQEFENDPRVDKVSEQLQAIRDAIQELRIEQGIPIPNVTVGLKTLELKAMRGVDIKE